MANFLLPSAYDGLQRIPGAGPTDPIETALDLLPRVKIPAGTLVYRGDRGGAKEPSAAVPAFFGNSETIAPYAKPAPDAAATPSNISAYRFTKDVELVELNLNSVALLVALLAPPVEDAPPAMRPMLLQQQRMLQAWFSGDALNPSQPIVVRGANGKPTVMKTPDGHPMYLNRVVADLFCSIGLPGWIALPYNVAKRQGLVQHSAVHGKVVAYPPELMLCKWKDVLERVDVPAAPAPASAAAAAAGTKGRRSATRRTTRRRSATRGRRRRPL